MGIYTDGKEVLKDIIFLSKGITDTELKNKILEIQSIFYELNDENRELRLENEELKNIKIIESELQRVGDFLKKRDADEQDLYCMHCWDNDKKLIRTVPVHKYYTDYMECFNCKFNSHNFS